MFIDQKTERDAKAKELQILKEEITNAPGSTEETKIPEVKEIKMKYESLKIMHSKEYNLRKDKEAKLEQCHSELQRYKQSLDDIYTQIDSMSDAIAQMEDQLQSSTTQVNEVRVINQRLESQELQLKVEITRLNATINTLQQNILILEQGKLSVEQLK